MDAECDPELTPLSLGHGATGDGDYIEWAGLKLPAAGGCAEQAGPQAQLHHALLKLARGDGWDPDRHSAQVSFGRPPILLVTEL